MVRFEADAGQDTEIVLTVYRVPATVLIDDRVFEEWSYDNAVKAITVKLPKGHVDLVIR